MEISWSDINKKDFGFYIYGTVSEPDRRRIKDLKKKSIATRELLHLGIPVVVSDIYGIRDIIKDGYNGLIFSVGDWK